MGSFKESIRRGIHQYLPSLAMHVRSLRVRRHVRRNDRANQTQRIREIVIDHVGLKIVAGPFTGMVYVSAAVCSNLVPKLLGTYELELAGVVSDIIGEDYRLVIDVGSAEGYYAVGFARGLPHSKVYAFDTDPYARKLCQKLSAINGVADRVSVRGGCTPTALESLNAPQSVIICDCEGYEMTLLDPATVPSLARSAILVECHDAVQPGVTEILRKRFASTHRMTTFISRQRDDADVQALSYLSAADRAIAVDEFRGEMQNWLWMTPTVM